MRWRHNATAADAVTKHYKRKIAHFVRAKQSSIGKRVYRLVALYPFLLIPLTWNKVDSLLFPYPSPSFGGGVFLKTEPSLAR
jgi:hypothetical protein